MKREKKRSRTVNCKNVPLHYKGAVVGSVRSLSYEEQFPYDTLYHPSPAFKRIEKMIVKDDYNPSRRKQRTYDEILDDIDEDLDDA